MVHTQRSTRLSEPRHKTCGSWHDRGRRGIVLPQIGSGEGVRFRVCSASGVLEHHGERCGRWSDRRRRPSTKAGRNRRMANETPGGQDPKFERRLVRWLLDSDPSIPWQVMRDLAEDPDAPVAAERMTGMRARAVAGFASVCGGFYPPDLPSGRCLPLGRAMPSSTDLRKGERRWTTGKGEHGARTGRIAGHPERGDEPGLPASRAPAVRPQYGTSTADMKHAR
jgi:hypothetical protein